MPIDLHVFDTCRIAMFDTSSRVPLDKEEVFNGQLLWGGVTRKHDPVARLQICPLIYMYGIKLPQMVI